jgi:Fe-S cluster assembly protein NifU
MWKYSEQLMDHFMNPRNVGVIENPDGHAEVGSPICGDAMTLDIEVDDQDRISEIRFRTFGCAGAIASASALTEMARGKSLDEALAIKNRAIADYLGGMPEEKYHCSVMGHEALHAAVADFRKKSAEVAEAATRAAADAGAAGLTLRLSRPGKAVFAGDVADPGAFEKGLSAALTATLGRPVAVELER